MWEELNANCPDGSIPRQLGKQHATRRIRDEIPTRVYEGLYKHATGVQSNSSMPNMTKKN